MSKIQLPNLESLEESPNTNDLFLIRRSGSNSDGKIRYSKLVKNILPQLTYDYNPINATDAFIMRRINSSDVYSPEEVKVQFKNLYSSVNDTIKTSNVFDVVSFTDSSVSVLIALKTSYGLPLTELKKNMEICFISDQDRLTDKKFKIRVDNISIDSGILLYNDSSVAKELKKDLEIRTIYNGTDFIISSISDIFTGLNFFDDSTIVDAGDLLIIRKKDESNNKKIKYYQLASNIIPQLEVYYDTITSSDLLPIRRIGPQGGYLESNDRKISVANLCNHVNNTIKTSNFFDVNKVEESSISTVIYLKTSYGLPVTELKKNMEVCFIPNTDYNLLGSTTGYKIRVDDASISQGVLLYYPYDSINNRYKQILPKNIEVRAVYNGENFLLSYFYTKS
jgi:hypothetical protein